MHIGDAVMLWCLIVVLYLDIVLELKYMKICSYYYCFNFCYFCMQ